MATYVLVPGGWHGGWWFQPVTEQLRRHGHDVYPITLTGLGDRRHLASATVNLDTHIEDVLRTIDAERIERAVFCAHSYGGMVTTGAADRIAEHVEALVYIDAQVPRDGESLWSLVTPSFRKAFIDGAAADGFSVAPPPGLDGRVTAHPLASFIQPIRRTGAADGIAKKYYVWLSEWEDSPTRLIYERLRDEPGWDVRTWPIGHDVVGEAADELVDFLLSVI